MPHSKLVTDEEYRFILDKVNRVICQFSSSTDKTSEAITFLARIEEKCHNKAEFLHLIEQRLQILTNTDKSQEYIDWFKVRRSSLASFLQGIKDKLRQDANYLSKYSPAFTKGVQCLDRLLKLDVDAIGHSHMVDLSRVRKAVLEMKSEIDARSKSDTAAATKSPFDESRLYSLLHDAINMANALYLQDLESIPNKPQLLDVLGRTKLDIDSHMAEHAVHMHRTSLYRAQCASALLADFLASHKTGTSSESVAFDKKTENECESATEVEKNTLSLPCTAIYAILCDLKGQEWKQLQRNSAQAPTATSVAHTNTPAGISTNSMENAAKKRRTSVTVGEVKFPMSLQRKLDALQAQQNNVEMALESERAADFARQSAENKALLEGFDWAFLLDLATFEGPAAVVAV